MRRAGSGEASSAYALGHWQLAPPRWPRIAAWACAPTPDTAGAAQARLLAGTGMRLPPEALAALVEELLQEGRVARTGTSLRLPGHQAEFIAADAALWQRIAALLEAQAAPPLVSGETATQLKESPKRVQSLLERAARRGLVFRVGETRFFLAETVSRPGGHDPDDRRAKRRPSRDAGLVSRALGAGAQSVGGSTANFSTAPAIPEASASVNCCGRRQVFGNV